MKIPLQEQLKIIRRGTSEIISEKDLKARLEWSLKTGFPLIVKAGFDPTAPDIHLGHTVLLRKLRHFQECGHKVVFLIGDATALVGDPSGQSQIRKMLTREEVDANARTYEKQVAKILKIDDSKLFERLHNSEWFLTKNPKGPAPFDFTKFTELAQKYTVARLIERDDFQKRLKENKPISFLELFYPLMQGYDSVKIGERPPEKRCDVEIGGTDQKFNMLVGRDLQKAYGQAHRQVVITMPLLEGTDGVQKMSKSLNNYIGIDESPKSIFAKTMSISDELMVRYYELLTDEDLEGVKRLHPREAKVRLAQELVATYHGASAARKARQEFEEVFSRDGIPEQIPSVDLAWEGAQAPTASGVTIALVKQGKLSLHTGKNSANEVLRQFRQGAVRVDGQKVSAQTPLKFGVGYLIQVAKRTFIRVKISQNKT